jgi:hypothetical protein
VAHLVRAAYRAERTMTWPRLLLCAAAMPIAVLLAACGDDPSEGEATPLAKGESIGEMRQQAGEALARYDNAVAQAGPSATPSVQPPPWDAASPPAGLSIESARGSETSGRLTVTFTGFLRPATEPCGADYYAEAVESDRAVVVIVIEQAHAVGEICPMVGHPRSAGLNLAKPLGKRAVLEARQGIPVPVTLALRTA